MGSKREENENPYVLSIVQHVREGKGKKKTDNRTIRLPVISFPASYLVE